MPEEYDNINQPPFDLQQLDLGKRCSIDDRTLRHERDAMYQRYRGEAVSQAVVSSIPNFAYDDLPWISSLTQSRSSHASQKP